MCPWNIEIYFQNLVQRWRQTVKWPETQVLRAFITKERLYGFHAFRGENSRFDLDTVVQGWVLQQVQDGDDRACFGVRRPENQSVDAGLHDCACAHGAWFNRYVEVAAWKAIVAQSCSCVL